jgi:hypothetical protein
MAKDRKTVPLTPKPGGKPSPYKTTPPARPVPVKHPYRSPTPNKRGG